MRTKEVVELHSKLFHMSEAAIDKAGREPSLALPVGRPEAGGKLNEYHGKAVEEISRNIAIVFNQVWSIGYPCSSREMPSL